MRIAGITIPEKKQLAIGLTAIHGVGYSQAARILESVSVPPTKHPEELSTE